MSNEGGRQADASEEMASSRVTDTPNHSTAPAARRAVTAMLNPLPRSVRRGPEYELLDGQWAFAPDPHDIGLREHWYEGHTYTSTSTWPVPAARAEEERTAEGVEVAWYERSFDVPPSWTSDPNRVVLLTLGACGFETRVWLNGTSLHTIEGEAIHLGEYTSFSYELPGALLASQGPNRLTVRTYDSLDAEIPRGKQESRVYKRGGIWYQTISGPVRSAWLEPVYRNRLRSRLEVRSLVDERIVEFGLTVRVQDPGWYVLRLAVTERPEPPAPASVHDPGEASTENGSGEEVVETPVGQVTGPTTLWENGNSLANLGLHSANGANGANSAHSVNGAGAAHMDITEGANPLLGEAELFVNWGVGDHLQRVSIELPAARPWSPDDPVLYRLRAVMYGPVPVDEPTVAGGPPPAPKVSDSTPPGAAVEANFGLRSIEARGRHVYLNGEPMYLDGVLYQPGTATTEQIALHMEAVKRLGCNLARVHIAGIDPRIYDLADQIGLLLWVEVPSPHSSSQRSRDLHRAELDRLLQVAAHHPSVIIVSLYNEDWGVQDIAYNKLTRNYIERTVAYMHAAHPHLLVVDNDGWRHVSTDGRLESDLLTAHIYTPNLNTWEGALDHLLAGGQNPAIEIGDWRVPLTVGSPFMYAGQVPFIVSEWGGFGWSGYGGPEDSGEGARAERIREFKRAMRARNVAGDVYTQATSIETEVNGVIDPESGALQVPPGVLGPPSTSGT